MATATPTPGTPQSFVPSGAIPGAPQYLQDNLTAKQAYQNSLARLNQQRQSTLLQYGYQGTVDPTTGVISKVGVNPNAPYGLYQQMLRTGAQNAYTNQYGLQDRGIAGGLANAANRDAQYQFGMDSAQLGQNLSSALFGLQDQQDQAKYQYDQTLAQSEALAAQNAISNHDFTTAPPVDPVSAQPNPTTTPTAPVSSAARLVQKLVQKKGGTYVKQKGGAIKVTNNLGIGGRI